MAKHLCVLMIMYDLPVKDAAEKKSTTSFRKSIMKMGFMSIQKSIYVKVIRNNKNMINEVNIIKKIAPNKGTIQVIPMSMEQFKRMKTITGECFNMSLFADELVVV